MHRSPSLLLLIQSLQRATSGKEKNDKREKQNNMFILLIFYCRWLGEKYDGVRCLWNSENSTLYPTAVKKNEKKEKKKKKRVKKTK